MDWASDTFPKAWVLSQVFLAAVSCEMLLNWLFACLLCSLVLLVILNMMLFYKLWMLEYTTQTLTAWQGLRLQERYSHACWGFPCFLWMSEAFPAHQSSGLSFLRRTGEAEGP